MPIPGSREDRRAEKKDDYFGSLISHTSTKHCWEGRDTEIITINQTKTICTSSHSRVLPGLSSDKASLKCYQTSLNVVVCEIPCNFGRIPIADRIKLGISDPNPTSKSQRTQS